MTLEQVPSLLTFCKISLSCFISQVHWQCERWEGVVILQHEDVTEASQRKIAQANMGQAQCFQINEPVWCVRTLSQEEAGWLFYRTSQGDSGAHTYAHRA